MARVVTNAPVSDFLLGGQPDGSISVDNEKLVDVAYWVRESQIMISIVNGAYNDINGPFSVRLPETGRRIAEVPFGNLSWNLVDAQLVTNKLPTLSTSLVIIDR
ncbi:hypothetical protein PC116_g30324 [Phytophthora cactorum]|nr:hypothetical protein PC116_g30324 [Phytophthora cactorum]